MRTKLYFNGQTEWPDTIELLSDIVDEYQPRPGTVEKGVKRIFRVERIPDREYTYTFTQPVGDQTLFKLVREKKPFHVRVVYVEEFESDDGKVEIKEYAECVLRDLVPVRRRFGGGYVELTVVTMTAPEWNPEVKPQEETAEAS
jgi:hypothetical protein